MSPALLIIFGTILVAALVGVYAGRRMTMNLENWTVGGRRFGVVLMWLLMAGEIYTTFTFLGASGWAYGKGAPTYYILIYGTLAYTLSFFILPKLWRLGSVMGCTPSPIFSSKLTAAGRWACSSPSSGFSCILPYLQLQLSGLGMVVEIASEGAIRSKTAIVLAFLLTCAFVYTSGIRGSAWVSVIKDVMMIAAVAIVGFGLPRRPFRRHRENVRNAHRPETGPPCLSRRGAVAGCPVGHVDRAPDGHGILHVAAHLRLGFLGQERADHQAQRDHHAALSTPHPACSPGGIRRASSPCRV